MGSAWQCLHVGHRWRVVFSQYTRNTETVRTATAEGAHRLVWEVNVIMETTRMRTLKLHFPDDALSTLDTS